MTPRIDLVGGGGGVCRKKPIMEVSIATEFVMVRGFEYDTRTLYDMPPQMTSEGTVDCGVMTPRIDVVGGGGGFVGRNPLRKSVLQRNLSWYEEFIVIRVPYMTCPHR